MYQHLSLLRSKNSLFKVEPFIVTLIITIVLAIALSELPSIMFKAKFTNAYSAVIDIKTHAGIDYAYWGEFQMPLEINELSERYQNHQRIKSVEFDLATNSVNISTHPNQFIEPKKLMFTLDTSDQYSMQINCKNSFSDKKLEPLVCRE